MAAARIELFGNLRITWHGETISSVNTSRLQSLLGFLLLHCGVPQPREQLAFLLWRDSSESQARTNLRQLIHHLRRALPAEVCFLSADHQTLMWQRTADCVVDVIEFDEALARASAAVKQGNATVETDALEQAARIASMRMRPMLRASDMPTPNPRN